MSDRQRGASLPEMIVVLALTGVVAVPILTAIGGAYRSERSLTTRFDVAQDVDFAIERFEDDARGASGSANSRSGDPRSIFTVESPDGSSVITWSLEDGDLTRREVDVAGSPVHSDVVLVTGLDPVSAFEYWSSDGTEVDVLDAAVAPCARRVRFTLVISGEAEQERIVDVAYRTPREDGATC